jgi:hypothetical protein
MSGKGYGRKRSWPKSRYYPGICKEGLKKTTNSSVRVAGLLAEIGNLNLPNTKQEC